MGWLWQLAASWPPALLSSYLHPDSQLPERNVNSAFNSIACYIVNMKYEIDAYKSEACGEMSVASMELAKLLEPDLSHQLPPGRLWHLLVIPRSAQ